MLFDSPAREYTLCLVGGWVGIEEVVSASFVCLEFCWIDVRSWEDFCEVSKFWGRVRVLLFVKGAGRWLWESVILT